MMTEEGTDLEEGILEVAVEAVTGAEATEVATEAGAVIMATEAEAVAVTEAEVVVEVVTEVEAATIIETEMEDSETDLETSIDPEVVDIEEEVDTTIIGETREDTTKVHLNLTLIMTSMMVETIMGQLQSTKYRVKKVSLPFKHSNKPFISI